MPQHRVPGATLHEDLISITREGEHITSVTPAPNAPGFWLVLTEYEIETRPALGAYGRIVGGAA